MSDPRTASPDVDAVVSAETPEGILLDLRPAGLTARCLAFALDWLIRLAVLYGVATMLLFLGGLGFAFLIVALFVLEWFYPVYFELGRSGATPGKKLLGLKVVMDNGLPVTPAASLTRNLLRVADFLPFFYGFAIVSILVRGDSKRLGDVAAATLVVHGPRAAPKIKLDTVEPVAPRCALAPRDQAAVIALAARAPTLTAERLDELAALAAAVSGDDGRSGRAVTQRVLGVAQWLMGRRT
jgi:uncharacterized RDD family membrane protein YckC